MRQYMREYSKRPYVREQKNAWFRKYYHANLEKIREYNKLAQRKHRQKIKSTLTERSGDVEIKPNSNL